MDEVKTTETLSADPTGQGAPVRPAALEAARDLSASSLFVQRVPISFARRFSVLGLEQLSGVMPVAVASSESLHALDKVSVLLGTPTEPVFVDDKELLHRAINQAYGLQESVVDEVIRGLGDVDASALMDELNSADDLLDNDSSSPVTRLVNLMLLDAVKRRASDIHIQPFADHLQVRLRIDGVLYDYVRPPRDLLDRIVTRIKVMGKMNIAEKRLAQDGRTTVMVGEKVVDLRISSLPTSFGERVVLRLLDKSARLYRLCELGMSAADMASFDGLIRQNHGIILVTGPTGSGKSTTLYAALQELDCKELNVLTLEDPIEYQLSGISQTQVSDKKGMTFATGLRTVLRQDPDVIMVGEIRDKDTARMAIQSSLTGHLVFSTLHTNDAAGAIARLLDLGVEPYLVAGSLLGVLAQRLVRKVCVHCRSEHALTQDELRKLNLPGQRAGVTVCEANGCDRCHGTGYYDRAGIFELLQINGPMRDLIAGNPRSTEIKQSAHLSGMTTLREDALGKLLAGHTTIEEVLRVTHGETSDDAEALDPSAS